MDVNHDQIGQKFVIEFPGKDAVLAYTSINDIIDIYMTFVPDELRGQGIAELLAKTAFEFAKQNNMKVIPSCPYIKGKFLEKYKEYTNMITEGFF